MCDFMRGDYFPVSAITPVQTQCMAHCGVEVIADRDPHQFRPRLSEVARRLLRDLHVFEQGRAEIVAVELYGQFAFRQRFLIQ